MSLVRPCSELLRLRHSGPHRGWWGVPPARRVYLPSLNMVGASVFREGPESEDLGPHSARSHVGSGLLSLQIREREEGEGEPR